MDDPIGHGRAMARVIEVMETADERPMRKYTSDLENLKVDIFIEMNRPSFCGEKGLVLFFGFLLMLLVIPNPYFGLWSGRGVYYLQTVIIVFLLILGAFLCSVWLYLKTRKAIRKYDRLIEEKDREEIKREMHIFGLW